MRPGGRQGHRVGLGGLETPSPIICWRRACQKIAIVYNGLSFGRRSEGLTLGMLTSGRAMSNFFVRQTRQRSAAGGRVTATGRRSQRAAVLSLVGCAILTFLATGCTLESGMSRVIEVTPARFNAVILQSQQPVLVNFYKPG
jgi:hypothetical protein